MTIKVNKAVILAGGKGTRLYPVTKEIPKPLLPVNRKPILNYLVDLFLGHGVNDIALLVSSDFKEEFEWWKKRYYNDKNLKSEILNSKQIQNPKSKIQNKFKIQNTNRSLRSLSPKRGEAKFKLSIFEEKEPLGTFGGLHLLKDWLGKEHFFMTNGDELKDINLKKMADFHAEKQPVGTIALVRVPDAHNYGVVLCKGHFATDFIEKPSVPPSEYINSGLYLFSPEVFDYHAGPVFTMLEKDIFPKLAKEGKLAGFKFRGGRWMDCGTWERYERALKEWKS